MKSTKLKEMDLASIICDGIKGEKLLNDWNEWLNTLRDYIKNVKSNFNHVPKRVVITNGDWLILFVDPENAFLSGFPEASKISIWENKDDIEKRYNELFRELEYNNISEELVFIRVEELLFKLDPNYVKFAINGVKLLYIEQPNIYDAPSPIIKIEPVIILGTNYEKLFCIVKGHEGQVCTIPSKYEQLPNHLEEVKKRAEELFEEIKNTIGKTINLIPLSEYYEKYIDSLKTVTKVYNNSKEIIYLIITGTNTHYLSGDLEENCSYHSWLSCQKIYDQHQYNIVLIRTTKEPRSYFKDGELYHCARQKVLAMKRNQITDENQVRCGNRSGHSGDPFCEIFCIDELLCCRLCVFFEVCNRTEVFNLPCLE